MGIPVARSPLVWSGVPGVDLPILASTFLCCRMPGGIHSVMALVEDQRENQL